MRKFARIVELPTTDTMVLLHLRGEEIPQEVIEAFSRMTGQSPAEQSFFIDLVFDMETFFYTHSEPVCCGEHGLETLNKMADDVKLLQEIFDNINQKHLKELGL